MGTSSGDGTETGYLGYLQPLQAHSPETGPRRSRLSGFVEAEITSASSDALRVEWMLGVGRGGEE